MLYNNTIISMKKSYFCFVSMLLAVVVVSVSCTDFFSTSWASWAARDPDNLIPAVTPENVDELIAKAENNPDLSLALLKKIQSAANSASGTDKQKLQNSALEAAVNAAGLGQAVLGVATDLGSLEDDSKSIVIDAINGMDNLDDAASILADILAGGFDDSTADPNDMAMAAVVLLAAEAKKSPGGIDDYIDHFQDTPLNPVEQLAVDLALAAKDNVSGPLKDLLDSLNLIS